MFVFKIVFSCLKHKHVTGNLTSFMPLNTMLTVKEYLNVNKFKYILEKNSFFVFVFLFFLKWSI